MYEYLKGKVIQKSATALVLEVNGVGYSLQIPLSTFEQLPALEQSATVLTRLVVREDSHTLFGFATDEERDLFTLLTSVSGIGPKLGITILSGIRIPDLKRAIVEGQLDTLKGISGIGKRTAERLVVELREKIVVEGQKASESLNLPGNADNQLVEDSMQALLALGYKKQNAKTALEKVFKEDNSSEMSVEGIIRSALKHV